MYRRVIISSDITFLIATFLLQTTDMKAVNAMQNSLEDTL